MRSPESVKSATPDSVVLCILLGAAIAAALSFGQTREIWSTGAFFDTDDAARLVQVRDWMAGQPWYDLHMHRLGLPGAEPMHWTRVVDVPVALLVRASSVFLDVDMAERAARILFPTMLSAGLIAIGALIAIELAGRAHALVACLVMALTGLSLLQFQPGRIDHHAPQILLLSACGLFALRSAGACRPRLNGFLSAACIAASLGISLENFPAALAFAACFAVIWAASGKRGALALNGFGLGLVTVMPLVYAATVAPTRWLTPACDAQSVVHVSLGVIGGLSFIALTTTMANVSQGARWLGILAMGAGLALFVWIVFPQCGLDPYGGIDPLVRREWLDAVREAASLPAAWSRGMRWLVVVNYVPALIGLAGLGIAVLRSQGEARRRWSLWLCVSSTTFLVAAFRFGYVQTFQVFASFGVVYLLSLLPDRLRALRIPLALASSVVALAMILPADDGAARDGKAAQCTRPIDAAGLTSVPAGRLLAPIDQGAYLLAFTKHQIVAAPYHRNNEGNRLEAEAFTLPGDEALKLLRLRHVDYVAICGEERRRSPLIEALTRGVGGVMKVAVAGGYDLWRIDP